ncbi:MAG: hypothetical protein LBD55_10615, partial [Treponema sp.]|nr:hypothetical protein [Treponema sp.]
ARKERERGAPPLEAPPIPLRLAGTGLFQRGFVHLDVLFRGHTPPAGSGSAYAGRWYRPYVC